MSPIDTLKWWALWFLENLFGSEWRPLAPPYRYRDEPLYHEFGYTLTRRRALFGGGQYTQRSLFAQLRPRKRPTDPLELKRSPAEYAEHGIDMPSRETLAEADRVVDLFSGRRGVAARNAGRGLAPLPEEGRRRFQVVEQGRREGKTVRAELDRLARGIHGDPPRLQRLVSPEWRAPGILFKAETDAGPDGTTHEFQRIGDVLEQPGDPLVDGIEDIKERLYKQMRERDAYWPPGALCAVTFNPLGAPMDPRIVGVVHGYKRLVRVVLACDPPPDRQLEYNQETKSWWLVGPRRCALVLGLDLEGRIAVPTYWLQQPTEEEIAQWHGNQTTK